MAITEDRQELDRLHLKRPSWPPPDEGLAHALARYVLAGEPLSLAGRDGIVAELEDEFAKAHGRRYSLAMSSGTTALLAGFTACGLAEGDEVVCVAYSYHATASPLLHLGVEIVFCDVEADTGNVSIPALRRCLSPRTKAIVTNHQWGHPVDVDAVRAALAELPQRVRWIEDCSHAHFAEYKGERVGRFGDASVFSLQAKKIVPAGEGGILLTDDEAIQDRATLWAYSLDRTETSVLDPRYRPLGRTGLGLKHRMHPLGAVVALYYLRERVPDWIATRNELLAELSTLLGDMPALHPPVTRPYVTSRGAFYGYKPRFLPEEIGFRVTLEEYVAALQRAGLEVAKPKSPPLYELPLFTRSPIPLPARVRPVPEEGLPGANAYSRSIISVPTFTHCSERGLMHAYASVFRRTLLDLLSAR